MGWEAILGFFAMLIPLLDSQKGRNQEHVELTLNTLSTAYFSTEAYFANVERGGLPSRKDQLLLAEKWDHVANLVRRYDAKLASRLSIKSRFWSEGGAWSDAEIRHANIGLERIKSDARTMLILKQHTVNRR